MLLATNNWKNAWHLIQNYYKKERLLVKGMAPGNLLDYFQVL